MSLTRKKRPNRPQASFRDLTDSQFRDNVQDYLNHAYEVLSSEDVVLPTREPSVDPEDGEFMFDGSRLFIVIGGEYKQVYPVASEGITWEETDVIEVTCPYVYPRPNVKYNEEDCAINATTEIVAARGGQQTAVAYIEVSNPDVVGKIVHFLFDGDSETYFKKFIAAESVVVQNFVYGMPMGASGKKFSAVVSDDGSEDLYITVGYEYI